MKRRITIILSILSCALLGTMTLLMPSAPGNALLEAVDEINDVISLPGVTDPAVPLEIVPSRHTLLSIFTSDRAIQSLRVPDAANPNDLTRQAALSSHKADAALSIRTPLGCKIHVSAQAFDNPDSPIHILPQAAPSAVEAWKYVLLHELGHCYWSAALNLELDLKARNLDPHRNADYLTAQAITESYADAYALLVTHKFNPEQARRRAVVIRHWRNQTTFAGMEHRTEATVASTLDLLRLDLPLEQIGTFEDLRKTAIQLAFTGSLTWMFEQGVKPDVAVRRINRIAAISDTKLRATLKTERTTSGKIVEQITFTAWE